MRYKIGQVLYVLLNKETKIFPVQVVEEITKRTLDGETINYIVRFGKKNETTSLSDMNGQIFDSVDSLRKTLHDRITRTVDAIITSTVARANEWYPAYESNVEEVIQEPIQTAMDVEEMPSEESLITLPDGTIAKLKTSPLGV